MKKNDVVIKVNPQDRKVYFNDNFLGLNAENLQSNLVFEFDGDFVNGSPRVEVEKDGNKYIITDVSRVNDTYVMEIKSSLLTTDTINMQLVITEAGDNEIPIFKSKQFYLIVGESINASTEIPDEYETLYDEIQEKIAEVNNLNVTGERVIDGVEITFTDKFGNEIIEKVNDGLDGQDGKDGKDGKDGTDGKDGKDGQDGFSPIANVEKVGKTATITITDKIGTTTASISDGKDGDVPQDLIDQIDLNSMVYNTLPKITGSNDTINNASNTPMELELLPSELEQVDEPTPDYPQEIHTVTGDNEVKIANSDNTLSQTYPITLGNLEYCKIGNYSDEFVKQEDKWYLKKNVRHVSLAIADMNNSEDYPGWNGTPYINQDYHNQNTTFASAGISYMSNINVEGSSFNDLVMLNTLSTNSLIMLNRLVLDRSQTEWKTNYPNLIFELYYGMPNPEYILLNNTLQTELNNIQKAVSYNEQTNIIQVNDDLPFIINYSANKNVPTKLSELTNDSGYVKDTDYATSSKGGVIRATTSYRIGVSNGALYAEKVPYADYANIWDNAFIGKGTLENVITGKGLVSNTNYASSSTGGVIKTSPDYFMTNMENGVLKAVPKAYSQYENMASSSFIAKGTLENVITGKELLSSSDVKNNVVSTDEDKPLSANMGKELNDRIQNLASIGKYLAMWDCTTGLPTTDPVTMPYTYTTGDYYVIGNIGQTNYMPNGATYTHTASQTQYSGTETLNVGDFFYYDGTVWTMLKNTGKTVYFANIAGNPTDNSNLASALNDKVGFTDYATNSTGGVIKTNTTEGTNIENGILYATTKSYQGYQDSPNSAFIGKGTLENVITGKGLVSNTNYATQNTGGVAKMWISYNEDNEIGLNISTE